ncbi:hypothetical protein L596_017662 [Steinernema carpocapsae]|uniref:Uncharacterized protein n=1 Tax=Steinernema carpocapsae TaxID=34508 RepID=A0A4U5N2B1_STECR|nr:hypothetical protein L596_017662 [Steinernema carpocapsae]
MCRHGRSVPCFGRKFRIKIYLFVRCSQHRTVSQREGDNGQGAGGEAFRSSDKSQSLRLRNNRSIGG